MGKDTGIRTIILGRHMKKMTIKDKLRLRNAKRMAADAGYEVDAAFIDTDGDVIVTIIMYISTYHYLNVSAVRRITVRDGKLLYEHGGKLPPADNIDNLLAELNSLYGKGQVRTCKPIHSDEFPRMMAAKKKIWTGT